jgi:ribosomal protein S18 acetylase RimI-like enzyme
VLLSVYPEFQGRAVGSALLSAAASYAREHGLPLVRVAISNDDIPLMYFYQRHGFTIYDIAVGRLVDASGASVAGFSGIPSRDEIHLRRPVCDAG